MLSISGKIWKERPFDRRLALAIEQKYNVPSFSARVVAGRNTHLESAYDFLDPKIKNLLPNPFLLLDMEKAVNHVIESIGKKKKIIIYGDYDVDGATSTALLRRYFQENNYPVDLYIPDRIKEGYGANTDALLKLKKKGYDLVLMTDCGTTSFEPLEAAKKAELDIIVFDHHISEVKLPPTIALVNPNRVDQKKLSALSNLCAAGVVFLFLVALQSRNYFEQKIDLMNYLDIVALGTVCDVMPLVGLNRAFVQKGLKVLQTYQNIGLKALCEISNITEKISSYHLGYVLGPKINAGGRIGKSNLGSKLLTTQNYAEAKEIAQELHAYNLERQEIENKVLEEAHAQIQKAPLQDVILVGNDSWHPGVIGIIASRLKEFYQRPACVVGFVNNEGKGSGRSVFGKNLGKTMHKGVSEKILEKGGGHEMAAGFSVKKENFSRLQEFLNQEMPLSTEKKISYYDFSINLKNLNFQMVHSLKKLEPFGQGCSSITLLIQNVYVRNITILKNEHIKCQIIDDDNNKINLLAFRVVGQILEKGLNTQEKINIFGEVDINSWGGFDSLYIKLKDIHINNPL